jgi:threonine dehydrogenase-like Zn-dependent dehydrogenase
MGSRNALPEDFRQVMAMLDAGRFPVEKTVTAVIPLADGPAMLAEWSANPAAFTKIMIQMHH